MKFLLEKLTFIRGNLLDAADYCNTV